MKKENNIESDQNQVENINKLENFESKQTAIKEEKEGDSGSFRTKKESELTNSLPLSFDIPEKEYSQQVKENPNENFSLHQVPIFPNHMNNIHSMHGGNVSGLDRSFSPFVVDVHKLSFNNMEFSFPQGRALLFNNNK
jgi:hypothetical protein